MRGICEWAGYKTSCDICTPGHSVQALFPRHVPWALGRLKLRSSASHGFSRTKKRRQAIPTIFLPNFGRTASQEFVQKDLCGQPLFGLESLHVIALHQMDPNGC